MGVIELGVVAPTVMRDAWWATIRSTRMTDDTHRQPTVTRALVGIGAMASAYSAVSGVRKRGTDANGATLSLLTFASQLIGTVVWGEVVPRTRRPWFLVAGPAIGASGAMGSPLPKSVGDLYPSSVGADATLPVQLMCATSMPIDVAERATRPRERYVASYRTPIIPFSTTALARRGAHADATGLTLDNVAAIGAHATEAVAAFGVVRPPRRGREVVAMVPMVAPT
jgi:hypothetical protein